jgi:hypothetical protein
MNFQRQYGEITCENSERLWNTAFESFHMVTHSNSWISLRSRPVGFMGYALGACDKVIEFVRLYIRIVEIYGMDNSNFIVDEKDESLAFGLLDIIMNKLEVFRVLIQNYKDYEYFEDPISRKQNTIFELESELRTLTRTRSFKAELLERTWRPERYFDWCVPSDEKEFIQTQFIREETCHTILKTGKRDGE